MALNAYCIIECEKSRSCPSQSQILKMTAGKYMKNTLNDFRIPHEGFYLKYMFQTFTKYRNN